MRHTKRKMSDVISKFERLINRINILYGLILPVGLMTLVAFITWAFVPEYFQPRSFLIHLVIVCSVAFVFSIHFKFLEKLSSAQLKLLYLFYHCALISFCIFVAPFRSPYEFLWVSLAVGMDIVFKKYWMYLTFLFYALTLTISLYITHQTIELATHLPTAVQFIGVLTTAFLVSRYRKVSDDERSVLDTSSKETSYERQRLLSLINNMGEAVVATNKAGKVLLYNAAVLNLLDTNQSLEGKSLDSLLKLRNKDHKPVKILSLLKDSPVGITSTDYLHEFAKDDAINIYINIASIKLGFKEESGSGYIVIMRDITKEKSLEEERDEFISVVSHELRTPVAIAEGNISNAMFMSKSSKDKKIVADALKQAHEQVLFLASMINDLATLSRAERTDYAVEITEVDPRALIHDMARDYEAQAASKKLKLTASAAADTKLINTSELYLHEILQNFVTNSIKYTKKGSVVLHVRSNKNGDAVFSVADTGIGLSKADQKRVFDKFFRSEDFRTRESSGTGLGLYVTAKLAHKINAQITLESELNKGSTFTITVPSQPKPTRSK